MTEGQSSASREGRGASVTMLAAREARSRRAATVCRPCLRRWTRSTDAGWPRRQSDRLRPHPGEASRGCPTHGRESSPRHRAPSCRERQACAEPIARSANAALLPALRHSRERARGGTRAIRRAANRFPRAPEKLIAHNPAHLRTIPHYFAHNRGAPVVRRGVDGLPDAAAGFVANTGEEVGKGRPPPGGAGGQRRRGFVRSERRCP